MNKKVKKMGYQMGGPQMTGNVQPSGGQVAGSVMQGIGGVVSMIPGWGTAVGMGLAGIGSILQATSAPKMSQPVNYNTNPYGYAMGGDLSKLSNNAYQVKGNNPSKTDGVDMGKFMLDHNEVVVGDNVYSDTLKNPFTNRSFAQDEKVTQQIMGKVQRAKTAIKDNEYQDLKFLKKSSDNLFNLQENLASSLGLRDQNGVPVQEGKSGFMWGGKKPKYNNGGTFPPGMEWMEQPQFNWAGVPFASDVEAPSEGISFADLPTTQATQISNVFPKDATKLKTSSLGDPKFIYPNIPFPNNPIGMTSTSPSSARLGLDISPTDPFKQYATTQTPISNIVNQDTNTQPETPTTNNAMDNEYIRKLMNKLHPYGNAATAIGGAVSAMSVLGNKPFYVNYGNVGTDEIRQQNQALRRVVEGEKTAVQDATNASRSAMAELQNRSLQSRNANLRNIAQGEIESQTKARNQFAQLEANARMQIGARRTAIDQINLQKNMQQDITNTQEYDTMMKENMKALMNFRELGIEKQNVMNQVRRDEVLKGLLQTKDFKWDSETGQIVMKLMGNDPNLQGLLLQAQQQQQPQTTEYITTPQYFGKKNSFTKMYK